MSEKIPVRFDKDNVDILEESVLFRGFFSVVQYRLRHSCFGGGQTDVMQRDVQHRPAVAAVLPYDPVLDKIVMVEQFRIGALYDPRSPWLLEIIAGMADKDEAIESVASRESREEADLNLLDLIPIHTYWPSPGGSNERVHLFCGRVDASQAGGIHGMPEEHEDIQVHVLDPQQAWEALDSGIINNAPSIIALQWLKLHYQVLRSRWL